MNKLQLFSFETERIVLGYLVTDMKQYTLACYRLYFISKALYTPLIDPSWI